MENPIASARNLEWSCARASASRVALALIFLLTLVSGAGAQQAIFGAQQDNTMFLPVSCTVASPLTCLSNGVGPFIIVDSTNGGRRGLIQFDIDGTPQSGGPIPPGSNITSVVLRIHMSTASGANTIFPGNISITPLAQSWGQGTSNSGGEGVAGNGAPATTNDATWVHRFFSGTLWNHAGGTCRPNTACASAVASATTNIQAVGPAFVTWGSTSQMVANVQGWLDSPATNFGWLIRTLSFPARFDSSENPTVSFRPTLTVNYTPGSAPTITRSPASFTRGVSMGQNLSQDMFTVRNTGTGTLNYTLSENASFITSLSPSSGSSTGETDSITVNYNTAGLALGMHVGTITISSGDSGVTNSPQTISVTVNVSPSNDACLAPTVISSLPFSQSLDTLTAGVEVSDPIPPCGTGPDGSTVWYSVTRPTTEVLFASTSSSNYDTVVSVWNASGGCMSLSNLACNNDINDPGMTETASQVFFAANAGTPILIMVGHRNLGSGGNLEFSLIGLPEPATSYLLLGALSALAALRRSRSQPS